MSAINAIREAVREIDQMQRTIDAHKAAWKKLTVRLALHQMRHGPLAVPTGLSQVTAEIERAVLEDSLCMDSSGEIYVTGSGGPRTLNADTYHTI